MFSQTIFALLIYYSARPFAEDYFQPVSHARHTTGMTVLK